ncbi:MerR family transcriptional regulator [Companilactobacillus alimentarius]
MSEFTTGKLAKLTGISIRTLQYYDKRALLKPSKIGEGGRRIYTETDLSKLKLILLLKGLGLSLKAIAEILESKNSIVILKLLLEQQQKILKDSIDDSKAQLKTVEELYRNLPQIKQVSIKTIDDIEDIMNNKKGLKKVHLKMILYGLLIDVLEYGTLALGIFKRVWWPFFGSMILVIIGAIFLTRFYFQKTNYICPNCNSEFKPSIKEAFWASHNFRARKLTCPVCGKKDYCIEVYDNGDSASW